MAGAKTQIACPSRPGRCQPSPGRLARQLLKKIFRNALSSFREKLETCTEPEFWRLMQKESLFESNDVRFSQTMRQTPGSESGSFVQHWLLYFRLH